jgi:hypothetical protein
MNGRFSTARTEQVYVASPLSKRGEDEGEGFRRTSTRLLILTLPLSFRKREATQHNHHQARISGQP